MSKKQKNKNTGKQEKLEKKQRKKKIKNRGKIGKTREKIKEKESKETIGENRGNQRIINESREEEKE